MKKIVAILMVCTCVFSAGLFGGHAAAPNCDIPFMTMHQ